jgi:hypothetical protein
MATGVRVMVGVCVGVWVNTLVSDGRRVHRWVGVNVVRGCVGVAVSADDVGALAWHAAAKRKKRRIVAEEMVFFMDSFYGQDLQDYFYARGFSGFYYFV